METMILNTSLLCYNGGSKKRTKKGDNMKKSIRKIIMAAGILGTLLGSFAIGHKSYAAVNEQTTDTRKVELPDDVVLANTAKYKDMDYSFLKTFDYSNVQEAKYEYDTTEEMIVSNAKVGRYVKTKGYYTVGDGGAACYLISEEKETGGIQLSNGLYANIQLATYKDTSGVKWAVGNIKQFGAKGDGVTEDHDAVNIASVRIGEIVKQQSDQFDRGIMFMPEGEYKIANQININFSNLNIVGEGDHKTILFTDNDYRKEAGYTEFMFSCWGANNMYFGDFQIDAREVDLYHYMRQFVVVYSENVYLYNVDLNIPQSTYGSYYFEDKQYSNFCCYSGNKNVTVDDCRMEQMSGTYRGANIGVLDIWSSGEENITIMNCDLYGNARDEQIGFFSKDDENAFVRNVNFINNTVHSVQLKYVDIIGNRTMCFTIAYADSKNVENIHIAGNHFICETDSKFMTFGAMKNCVIEDNIIEIKCTYSTWSMVFDSSNSDPKNILVQNNDIFITSDVGKGKGNIVGGNLTLKGNRILSDVIIPYGVLGKEVHDNEIIALATIGLLGENTNVTGNKVYAYRGFASVGPNCMQIALYNDSNGGSYKFSNNIIYDYPRYNDLNTFRSLLRVDGSASLEVSNNEFRFPNTRFTTTNFSAATEYTDEIGKYYKNPIFRRASTTTGTVKVNNNKLQAVEAPVDNPRYACSGNQDIELEEDLNEELCSSAKIIYNGKPVTHMAVTDETIDLDALTYKAVDKDEDGNVISETEISGKEICWYTSSDKMATVDGKGVVTRHVYGEVTVYAVPLDGSMVYGECSLTFERKTAESISYDADRIALQPGLKYYAEYVVKPEGATQQLLWSSSDPEVATVDLNGMITGVAKGTATITGTTLDGTVSKSYEVVVGIVTVKKINLEQSYYYFDHSKVGKTQQLKVASYYPDNAENKGVGKWTSSNEAVAKVSDTGELTILSGGKTAIKVYSMDGRLCGTYYVYIQPGKLENCAATYVTNDTIELSWDKQEQTRSYQIYQWDDSTASWNMLNDQREFWGCKYTVNGLTPGKEYKFTVRPIVMRWEEGVIETYEGEDNIVTATTYSYIPVTSLRASEEQINLFKDRTYEFTVNYGPGNANFEGLDILATIEDASIASIEKIVSDTGKRTYTIQGKSYGTTTMKIKANDGWGVELNIPIGVVTNKQVPNGLSTEAVSNGVNISFTPMENEMALVSEGAITGYMVLRSTSIQFSNVKYIPASGLETYTYLDENVTPGKEYSYSVAPCYKEGDNYFLGYHNGYFKVKTSEAVLADRLNMEGNLYKVNLGEKIEIAAKVGPEDVSKRELLWTSMNAEIVNIERIEKETGEKNTDYALVEGVSMGGTTLLAQTMDDSELTASTTIVVTPKKVENLTMTSGTNKMELVWSNIEGVDGYYVYQYDPATAVWHVVGDTKTNSFEWTNDGTAGHIKFKVVAYIEYKGVAYEGRESDEVGNDVTAKPGENPSTNQPEDDSKNTVLVTIRPEDTSGNQNGILETSNPGKAPEPTLSDNGQIINSQKPGPTGTPGNENVNMPTGTNSVPASTAPTGATFSMENHSGIVSGEANVNGNYVDAAKANVSVSLESGSVLTKNGIQYKFDTDGKLIVIGTVKKTVKRVNIPGVVNVDGKKYEVKKIGTAAFKGCEALQAVTIGKNVVSIGAKAFEGDKKLKKITISGSALKKIGKNAVKDINRNATIIVKKNRKKKIVKQLTKETGYLATMKIITKE